MHEQSEVYLKHLPKTPNKKRALRFRITQLPTLDVLQNLLLHMDYIKHSGTRYGKKLKVTPVQALRLCTGRTAHRGSRGIALPFHDHGSRRG
jgi:hypothetical protein